MDFELEVGFVTGPGNPLGTPVPSAKAADHIFGLVLVNDWSARDIQRWEYVPLGPFLSKSFATTISPWVITLDALEPFRVAGPVQEPAVLDYLRYEGQWAHDIKLEVWLQPASHKEPTCISRTNFKHMYWNMAQQLAHQTSNGTNVQPGDLYASGTVSGPSEDSRGCLLELTWKGTKALQLLGGQVRTFLEDGDRVILRGFGQGDGFRVGFGECWGQLVAGKCE
jgi:fumarylacetoacetase